MLINCVEVVVPVQLTIDVPGVWTPDLPDTDPHDVRGVVIVGRVAHLRKLDGLAAARLVKALSIWRGRRDCHRL